MDKVIENMFPAGKFISKLFKIISFNDKNSINIDNFIESRSSKLMIFDYKDNIIPILSSLIKSVSDKIFEKITESKEPIGICFFETKEFQDEFEFVMNKVNFYLSGEFLGESTRELTNSYHNLDESYVSTEGGMIDELNYKLDDKQFQQNVFF